MPFFHLISNCGFAVQEIILLLLQETTEFVNVQNLRIVKKKVRPISQQEPNESRRLWKEVTAGLKFNDIDKATNAKFALEQKQRDEAKDRKEKNEEWETKVNIIKRHVYCFNLLLILVVL